MVETFPAVLAVVYVAVSSIAMSCRLVPAPRREFDIFVSSFVRVRTGTLCTCAAREHAGDVSTVSTVPTTEEGRTNTGTPAREG